MPQTLHLRTVRKAKLTHPHTANPALSGLGLKNLTPRLYLQMIHFPPWGFFTLMSDIASCPNLVLEKCPSYQGGVWKRLWIFIAWSCDGIRSRDVDCFHTSFMMYFFEFMDWSISRSSANDRLDGIYVRTWKLHRRCSEVANFSNGNATLTMDKVPGMFRIE